MSDLLQRTQELENQKMNSTKNSSEISQGNKNLEEINQKICQKSAEMFRPTEVSEIMTSFKRVRAEEERLLKIRDQILDQQRDLQNELIKEIEKKKALIASLVLEIPDLQKKNQQLGQELDIDIYK
jgi:TRAP-type mannitol/chloroaromatic compound transport system substrate-binding protein